MNVTVKATTMLGRDVTVCIAASRVDKMLDDELARLAGTARLPGFRPGKIPKKVLEASLRKQLTSQIVEQLVRETFPEAIEEHALQSATLTPRLTIGTLARGKEFVYTASISVYPEIASEGYTGLALTRLSAVPTEADVDDVVQHIRVSHASYEADGEHQAVLGDQVVLDFVGSIDGELFPGGQNSGHVLELGGNRFIPGFETQLLGCVTGEERQVRVTFPADYRAAHLAGKEALFECKIQEVRRRVLPPIDDALAEKVGVKEGGVAGLRAEIQQRLVEEGAIESARKLRGDLLAQLLEDNADLEVPIDLLQKESNILLARTKQEYQERGMDLQQMGMSDAQLLTSLLKPAKDRLTLKLVLRAISHQEGVAVDEAVLESHLQAMVTAYGVKLDQLRRHLQEYPERLQGIQDSVLEQQMVDWIIARGNVDTQTCSFAELTGKSVPTAG